MARRESDPRSDREHLPSSPPSSTFESSPYRDYVVKDEHGRGGLGRVLRAHDRRLDRTVALKELLGDEVATRVRFLREARLTARLQHPSIVPVYEMGVRADGAPFYAMKLIEGERLDEIIATAATVERRVALLPHVIAVAEAIAYAHEHRIIHRDLKPSNVIVGAFGETIVIDWGLAKDLDEEPAAPPSELPGPRSRSGDDVALHDTLVQIGPEASGSRTRTAHAMGTLAYMPPEQFRGLEVDERADVFALGGLLYHLVTGSAPYEGGSGPELVARIEQAAPVAIETRQPGVPPELSTIARKAMARAPSDRYPSAKELAAELKRFQAGQLVIAHAYSTRVLVARWLARHKRGAATALLFAIALGAVLAVSVRRVVTERDRAEAERGRAEARAQEMTLVQARTSLDRDPTASLAWLKTASLDPPSWSEVTSIAADARARGVARLVLPLKGIEGLNTVVVEPDGKRFVTTSHEGFSVWDLATGKLVERRSIPSHIHHPFFTADGAHMFAGTERGDIVDFNLRTDALHVLPGHAGSSYVQAGTVGAQITSCGYDGAVRAWDLETGASRVVGHHGDRCTIIGRGRDGDSVATIGPDHRMRIWDLRTGDARVYPLADGKLYEQFDWSQTGRYIVVHDAANALRALDLQTGAWRPLAGGGDVDIGAFAPNDDRYFARGMQGDIRVWDLARGEERVLRGHTGYVEWFDLTADGRWLVTCAQDSTIRVWDTRAAITTRILRGHTGPIHGCAFTPDGRAVVSAGNDGTVRVWDLGDDEQRFLAGAADEQHAIAFAPDGTRVASSGNEWVVHVWDRASGASSTLEGHTGFLTAIAFLGAKRLASASGDGSARVWDLAAHTSVVLPHGAAVEALAASADETTVITGTVDGVVRAWDVERADAVTMSGHTATVTGVAISPDGERVASAGDDTARLWNRRTGAPLFVLRGHTGLVTRVAFAKDGALVASGGADGTVRLWDAATGAAVSVLAGHRGPIESIDVGPDGRHIVTASADRTARIWDVDTGASIVLAGHVDEVHRARFSRDGAAIVTSGYDGTARVWDAQTGRFLALVRADAAVMDAALSPDARFVAATGLDFQVRLVPIDPSRFFPADAGGLRAWLDARTSAVVAGDGIASPMDMDGAK